MRITIIGGTGYAGHHIAAEAVARGHEVTSWSRNAPDEPFDGVTYRTGSLTDGANVDAALEGSDVVVSALAPRGDMLGAVRPVVEQLANGAERRGVRLGVIGGAGSLRVAEGGPRLMDTDGFPDEVKPEAGEAARVLEDLRGRSGNLDWFYISPAASFGGWVPGERTGAYRVGGDVLLIDDEGTSYISGPDFAAAILDEIEVPAHTGERFTVAY